MAAIGEKIAELRKSKEMTQEELASIIGVSAQSISKWENSATMPDVMLLPVIADIFEVSIDTLFGRNIGIKKESIHIDDIVDASFDALLKTMHKVWLTEASEEWPEFQANWVERQKKYLEDNPESQTAIYSNKTGAVYANSDIGLIFKLPKEGALSLIEDEDALGFIEALSNKVFRRIMVYQLKNSSVSYTLPLLAKKLDTDIKEAETALELIEKYGFARSNNVEHEDGIIKVFTVNSTYKMLIVYSIMSLSRRLANFHEHFYGFSGFDGTPQNWFS